MATKHVKRIDPVPSHPKGVKAKRVRLMQGKQAAAPKKPDIQVEFEVPEFILRASEQFRSLSGLSQVTPAKTASEAFERAVHAGIFTADGQLSPTYKWIPVDVFDQGEPRGQTRTFERHAATMLLRLMRGGAVDQPFEDLGYELIVRGSTWLKLGHVTRFGTDESRWLLTQAKATTARQMRVLTP